MKQGLGKHVDYHFDAAGLDAEAVARLTADMWADLPFDRDALAALKRDGLMLDGLNIGGPCPYRIGSLEGDRITVTADGDRADVLLDLWRMHFQRGLRPRSLAAFEWAELALDEAIMLGQEQRHL